MKKMANKGFSALETVLIVVVIGLIGFIGWYVYSQNHKKTTTKTVTVQTKTIKQTEDPVAKQIVNLDKAPQASRPLIISIAKDNIDQCNKVEGPKTSPETKVIIAQSNFVGLSIMSCETGHQQYLALQNNTWKDIGGGQMGLDCETIDKYNIVAGSYIEGLNEANNNCSYTDGRTKPIPN
jgi:hypothetical protein